MLVFGFHLVALLQLYGILNKKIKVYSSVCKYTTAVAANDDEQHQCHW